MAPKKRGRKPRVAKVATTSASKTCLMCECGHGKNRFTIGLVMLVIGLILLSVNLGFLNPAVLAYWPILIIGIGMALII